MDDLIIADRFESETPVAAVKRRRGISIVWVIPIVAALIGAFLAYRAYTDRGPTITLSFATAEGLEAGKTKLRYLDVEVGTARTVTIAPDLKRIMVTAEMVLGAENFLRERTTFWIVKPRIGVGGVSGLGTLLSGAYIGLAPGEGAAARSFTGLEQPPPLDANVAGRQYQLTATDLGSVSRGAPILYRGLDIGQVLDYRLAPDKSGLDLSIFVNAPYSDLVRTTSRFWNASGISVSTSASGVAVEVGSLQSLIVGGIEFDTPPGAGTSAVADAGASFPLYASKSALAQAQFTQKIPFLVDFDGSVRGLSPGAPVEFRGIKVG
ncbi:MAG: intermembrane transport protein PqiB, partial [Geminicoccaceae bacterium]